MRTTINLDTDVLERAKAVAKNRGTPFKTIVNSALRHGLDQMEKPAQPLPYQTKPHPMGLLPGRNLDNIQELLALLEGDDSR